MLSRKSKAAAHLQNNVICGLGFENSGDPLLVFLCVPPWPLWWFRGTGQAPCLGLPALFLFGRTTRTNFKNKTCKAGGIPGDLTANRLDTASPGSHLSICVFSEEPFLVGEPLSSFVYGTSV